MKNFEELLTIVPATANREVPQPKVLMKKGLAVVAHIELAACTITVYENGFYVCQIGDRYIAYAVDRCKGMPYTDGDGKKCREPEWKYMSMEWYIPLWVMAERRMAANIDNCACEHEVVCENEDGENLIDQLDCVPDPETIFVMQEEEQEKEQLTAKVRGLLDTLTPIQRRCIMEVYYNCKTQKQVAQELSDELGKPYTQQAVNYNIGLALKKMKKKF